MTFSQIWEFFSLLFTDVHRQIAGILQVALNNKQTCRKYDLLPTLAEIIKYALIILVLKNLISSCPNDTNNTTECSRQCPTSFCVIYDNCIPIFNTDVILTHTGDSINEISPDSLPLGHSKAAVPDLPPGRAWQVPLAVTWLGTLGPNQTGLYPRINVVEMDDISSTSNWWLPG